MRFASRRPGWRAPFVAGAILTALAVACAPASDDASPDQSAAAPRAPVAEAPTVRAPADAPRVGAAEDGPPAAADTLTVVVHRSPTCGCCKGWTAHMRAHGFRVTEVEQEDLTAVKAQAEVPALLHACHTARVGGYVVEGHVPAPDVRRLLTERPAITGIAAPGMPMGSPGMEGPYPPDRYNVLAFDRGGGGRVFAEH